MKRPQVVGRVRQRPSAVGGRRSSVGRRLNVIQAGQTGPQIQANDVIVVERSAFLTFVYTLLGLVRGGGGVGTGSIGVGGALPVR